MFRNATASLARAELQWGHGDWYGSNLIWQGPSGKETVSAVFDFSMADKTTRCFDIAVALERSMIDWMKPRRTLAHSPPFFRTEPEQIVAFLAGYERSHPLTMQEREDIAAFLPLAHITFACSEIWYYQALLNAPELAKTTYETYLLGHAQWFGTAEGKSLLNRIVKPERADI
nr:phosphotransferase [Asaia prunellae]